MEPGHEDREYTLWVPPDLRLTAPQWSPVMKTGNTFHAGQNRMMRFMPQWSPVMKTGNTGCDEGPLVPPGKASMEPGHEDREYAPVRAVRRCRMSCLNGARS